VNDTYPSAHQSNTGKSPFSFIHFEVDAFNSLIKSASATDEDDDTAVDDKLDIALKFWLIIQRDVSKIHNPPDKSKSMSPLAGLNIMYCTSTPGCTGVIHIQSLT